MLDILMSVHQEWIVKMASGEKTGELRHTWPKLCEAPFRVRLYCTRGRGPETLLLDGNGGAVIGDYRNIHNGWQIGNGFVVGEFICPGRTIVKSGTKGRVAPWLEHLVEAANVTCLAPEQILAYVGEGHGSVWHVCDVKIYDKPMELDRFFMPAERDGTWMRHVEKAPQSWCYIENIVRGVG